MRRDIRHKLTSGKNRHTIVPILYALTIKLHRIVKYVLGSGNKNCGRLGVLVYDNFLGELLSIQIA